MANLYPGGDFEAGIVGTISNGNAVVSHSSAVARSGSSALLVTASAAGNWSTQTSPRITIEPSTQYRVSAWFYSAAGVRQHRIQVGEHDSGGVAGAATLGTNTTLAAGTWTQLSVTFTSAADAASLNVLFVGLSAAAGGETFRVDDAWIEPNYALGIRRGRSRMLLGVG